MTPQDWIAVYRAWPPEIRREATALIAADAGMLTMLRAARGETGERSRTETREPERPTKLLARRASRCPICGRGIIVGEPIYYLRGRDAWHQRCEVRR